jgi:hypothetical protein
MLARRRCTSGNPAISTDLGRGYGGPACSRDHTVAGSTLHGRERNMHKGRLRWALAVGVTLVAGSAPN